MESSGSMPSLPFIENLRPGQRETVEAFSSKLTVAAKLPTGYGKTKTAAACYAYLRSRQIVNRLLYIVPRSAQATQAAEDVPAELMDMIGCKTSSHELSLTSTAAIRAHRSGKAEVFIATIQGLTASEKVAEAAVELMSTGQWMVVVDEHHHYGMSGEWTKAVERLPRQALLAMSATPDRPGERSVFGEPDVSVSYVDACMRDRAVKVMRLHSYEYRVDAVSINGEIKQFTTHELFDEVGSDNPQDIERFVASRKMRWSPKYISPLVLHPVERLIRYRTEGIRAQMVVQAMSCSHAQMVCEQIRALIPESMTVDWVGTGPNGRTDAENHHIVSELFCPPKDRRTGLRPWRLDILVNVGIAGEGLDSTDVAEVVFLTSPSINNSTLQTMGRGARVMRQPGSDDVDCIINVDGASELSGFIGTKVMHVFDGARDASQVQDVTKEDASAEKREYRELPDELQVSVLDVSLIDIKTDPMYPIVEKRAMEVIQKVRPDYSEEQAREIASQEAQRAIRDYIAERDARFNASTVIAQAKETVEEAVTKIASLVITMIAQSGVRIEKSFPGDVRRRINGRKKGLFGAVDQGSEVLQAHYRWLKELEREIRTEGIPAWLR